MSTFSKNEDKADGTPDPDDAAKAGSSADPDPDPDVTVVDAPWTAAAEPSDSVFADRAPGYKPAGSTAPDSSTATSTVPDSAARPSPEPKSLPPQPSTDRPVASAASAAAALAAKLGRQLTGGDQDGKSGDPGKAARKAHLQIARFEPWTVMKFSFVMSLVCFVILFVAVAVLYVVLSGLGVFDSISDAINETTRSPGQTSDAGDWFSAGRILGYTALLGALNILLITALATVGSVIYNLATEFVGGIEVTLKEAD